MEKAVAPILLQNWAVEEVASLAVGVFHPVVEVVETFPENYLLILVLELATVKQFTKKKSYQSLVGQVVVAAYQVLLAMVEVVASFLN